MVIQLSRTRMTESPRRNLRVEVSTIPGMSSRLRFYVIGQIQAYLMCLKKLLQDATTHILLMKRSLLTPFPLPPFGFSVHISFTFSRTMLQCRSKAFTRASSLRLFRQEIRTWVWERVAVWRMESGPDVSSCSSTSEISYSLFDYLRNAGLEFVVR